MKNLKAKLKKEGGFTLIEMLIVVAIIAILVAISIPLINQALERSREATDAANERSFKAVLLISFLNGQFEQAAGGTGDFNVGYVYAYDAAAGTIIPAMGAGIQFPAGYGKSTPVRGIDTHNRKGGYLVGYIDDNSTVNMFWDNCACTAHGGTTCPLIAPELVAAT